MTDSEIIKALEQHGAVICCGCPLEKENNGCATVMCRLAVDLINRQKAEIERLTAMVEAAEDYLHPLPFKNAFDNELEKAKSEAVKKFAEMVKMRFYYHFDELIPSIMADEIDSLVKEMVGDSDE